MRDTGLVEETFRKDWSSLCRLAALLTGDSARAEELVMDVFARCLRDRPSLHVPAAASAYFRRAVVNRSRNHLRRRTTEWRVNALHAAREPQSSTLTERDFSILAAVQALPHRQRAAVILSYFADLSEAEVAATLGMAPGTVKSTLSKARAKLAVSLKELR